MTEPSDDSDYATPSAPGVPRGEGERPNPPEPSDNSWPDWGLNAVLAVMGIAAWGYAASRGDPLGVNIGFMCVAIAVGSQLGWL